MLDTGDFDGFGIIQGWEAIGRFIGRSVRTARRWYDCAGLPVRYGPSGRPFVLREEIERYMVKVDELNRKNPTDEEMEKRRQHAAMMRKRKATLRVLRTFGIGTKGEDTAGHDGHPA